MGLGELFDFVCMGAVLAYTDAVGEKWAAAAGRARSALYGPCDPMVPRNHARPLDGTAEGRRAQMPRAAARRYACGAWPPVGWHPGLPACRVVWLVYGRT